MKIDTLQNIRKIEDKYGAIIFRCGLQHMVECGTQALLDSEKMEECKEKIIEHEKQSSNIQVVTANFQCGILDCAVELSEISTWDLIRYIKDYVTCDGTRDYKMCLDYENDDAPDWQGSCPRCSYEFNSELICEYSVKFCPCCGQAIATYQRSQL